jgi:hypothetical protein
MFDPARLGEVLELQRRTYLLLQWMNDAVKVRRITFTELHGNLDTAAAARGWLERNHGALPAWARPEPAQLDEFAHLFASYLATSFEPAPARRISSGCYCAFCSYFVGGPRLRAKTPTERARALGRKLEVNALEKLALELGLPLFAEELERFLGEHAELDRDVALVTWTLELFRRGEFRGQGEPVLALWREFAWKKGKPIRDFATTAEMVLEAEARIAGALRKAF